ncbi:MAG: slipin family protein [Pseudomonadota bacterium]
MAEVRTYPFRTVVLVSENERVLVLKDGQFSGLLRPGRHAMAHWRRTLEFETYDLALSAFMTGKYAETLMRKRPDLAKAHLTELRTSADEVALIYRDCKLHAVQRPERRTFLWTDAGPWDFELVSIADTLEVPAELAKRINAVSIADQIKRFNMEEGQKGLLYVENVFERVLEPGAYVFWNVGRSVQVKLVDMRTHALDVAGQEVLTRDRVSIRVNLAATYRVTDPVKAVGEVKDFAEALYRALQHAFRQSLGAKTLDQILADKVTVDAQAAKTVRQDMAKIGVEVGEIAVKDIILPGEMRDILNQVVEAEKAAEANVIRRREETSATRALLNTAKVMAENPVMLRLKELEALEKIADKVQTLTVHNGTKGLLEDIVSLSGSKPAPKRKAAN